jgi:hypothetical protein
MFSAPAVASMVDAMENSKTPPTSVPVVLNMGPASSAEEAFEKIYKSLEPKEEEEEEEELPKKALYNCDYCAYKTPYQHNKNRHEKLVHAVVHPPKKFRPKKPVVVLPPENPTVMLVHKRPSPKHHEKPESHKKPKLSLEERESSTEKEDKKTETMVVENESDMEKKEGNAEGQEKEPVRKLVKAVEKKNKQIQTAPVAVEEEAAPPTENMKCLKVENGGRLVFYAKDITIHISH